MGFVNYLDIALLDALIVQLVTFSYALYRRRVDIIDTAWGMSFIAIILTMRVTYPSTSLLVAIVDLLVIIWGVRLSWHISVI